MKFTEDNCKVLRRGRRIRCVSTNRDPAGSGGTARCKLKMGEGWAGFVDIGVRAGFSLKYFIQQI